MINTSIKFSASKIVSGLVILALAAGVGYYIWQDIVKHQMSNIPDTLTGIKNKYINNGIGVEGIGDFKVEEIPFEGAVSAPIPDLDRPVNITVDMPEEAKEIYRKKIKELSSALKENPDLFNNWLDLGIYRQNIGDYEGAKECWEYAGNIRPQNSTSFQNLGYLYAYYLKDNKKAEENYLKALENGPEQVYIYRNVYEFYHYAMKDDVKAKEILKKGIRLNPDASQDLQYLLDNF